MKKSLLLALSGTLFASAFAENKAYTYTFIDEDDYEYPVSGSLRRVSPNGRWAAGGDEAFQEGSFIIDTTNPTEFVAVPDGFFLDIDDNGMAIGSWYEVVGEAKYERAAIYRDGEWTLLPNPQGTIGRSYAVGISDDSRHIAGHAFITDPDSEIKGRYYPVMWVLDDATGNYVIEKAYNDLHLPSNYGFFVQDITPDGTTICGYVFTEFGNIIEAMIRNGEYTIWHKLSIVKDMEFTFRDEVYTKDAFYIDGLMESDSDMMSGYFAYATDDYLFGMRSEVTQLNDSEGRTGETVSMPTVYDLKAGKFIDGDFRGSYICGVAPDKAFTTSGTYINGNKTLPIDGAFDVETDDLIQGILSIDRAGKVLTGEVAYFNPAINDYAPSPLLIICDDKSAVSGFESIALNPAKTQVLVAGRTINVSGAATIAVYDMEGHLISNSAATHAAPGIYVVIADGQRRKVLVK